MPKRVKPMFSNEQAAMLPGGVDGIAQSFKQKYIDPMLGYRAVPSQDHAATLKKRAARKKTNRERRANVKPSLHRNKRKRTPEMAR